MIACIVEQLLRSWCTSMTSAVSQSSHMLCKCWTRRGSMYTPPKDSCYLALFTFANVQHDIVRNHEIIETMSKKSPMKLFDQHPFSNCNGGVCNDHLKSNCCDRNGSLH
jgi:hypothetical protein